MHFQSQLLVFRLLKKNQKILPEMRSNTMQPKRSSSRQKFYLNITMSSPQYPWHHDRSWAWISLIKILWGITNMGGCLAEWKRPQGQSDCLLQGESMHVPSCMLHDVWMHPVWYACTDITLIVQYAGALLPQNRYGWHIWKDFHICIYIYTYNYMYGKTSTGGQCLVTNLKFPQFIVEIGKDNPPPPVGIFMFPSFFFFLLPAFFCLGFSSLPLLFNILKPKHLLTRSGLRHI